MHSATCVDGGCTSDAAEVVLEGVDASVVVCFLYVIVARAIQSANSGREIKLKMKMRYHNLLDKLYTRMQRQGHPGGGSRPRIGRSTRMTHHPIVIRMTYLSYENQLEVQLLLHRHWLPAVLV